MNGPLDCPFCGNRPTHWYVEEGQPYVVCDSHSEPIRMRLSDWNVRASLVGDKRRPPPLPTPGSRLQAAISLWHRWGDSNVEEWEDETHKAEYLDAIDGLATGWLFNILLSRINFDGMDPRSFSLAEFQRAIVGAEWPEGDSPAVVGSPPTGEVT